MSLIDKLNCLKIIHLIYSNSYFCNISNSLGIVPHFCKYVICILVLLGTLEFAQWYRSLLIEIEYTSVCNREK